MNASLAAARAGERYGPFEVTGTVALGGMAVVYRAVHVATGEAVALKTVHAPRPSMLEALRREIFALSRLRHPGVVRVVGQGVADGVPWYAMEILEGGSLDEVWKRHHVSAPTTVDRSRPASGDRARGEIVGGRPIDRPRDALTLLRRLCATLAFLHGEGVVHRDLKPGNVVVRASGEPVLVDFGLAARFAGALSREALEIAGETAGTIGYMAPEQIRGEYVDARADLYALGCMAYEALTGRVPFIGRTWEVAGHHLRTPPAPPSAHADGISPELDALVLRLLAKDPRDRFGHAIDVARELDRVAELSPESMPVAPRAYLYRPSFAGRADVLARLRKDVAAADRGEGRRVWLSGVSGAGKTRLAMEVARCARQLGMHVVAGECQALPAPGSLAAPLAPLVPVLRSMADHCRAGGQAMSERVFGRRAKVLAAYEPELARLPGQEEHPEPAVLAPQAARTRLLADLAESLVAFANEVPTLVVLDDLHWADELTLAVLAALRDDVLAGGRLMIVGTYRREEVGDALRAFLRGRPVVELGRLDAETIRAIVCDMMASSEPPEGLLAHLARESDGNPFFVAEYLRSAVDDKLLTREASGRWHLSSAIEGERFEQRLAAPPTLVELVQRRVSSLSVAARALVEAAAVLGREVDVAVAAAMVGFGEVDRLEAVAELVERSVLEDADDGRLRFVHDKLREAVDGSIAPARRVSLHAAAARELERRGGGPAIAATLARHAEAAGDDAAAVRWLDVAGDHALRLAAHAEAAAHLERALDIAARGRAPATRSQRARWLRCLGEARFGLGDVAGANRAAKAALDALDEGVPVGTGAWSARLAVEVARHVAHRVTPRAARTASPAGPDALEAAHAAGNLAETFFFTNEAIPMLTAVLLGLNRAEAAGSPATAVEAYARLGFVVGTFGATPVARAYFRRAYALARDAGDERGFGFTRYLDAFWHLGRGEWERVELAIGESVARLRAIGDRQDTEVAQTIGAHATFYRGRFAEAERVYASILSSARERENAQHIGWGLFLGARSQLALGRIAEARANLEAALPVASLRMDVLSVPICEGLLVSARLAAGDLDGARGLEARLAARVEGPPLVLVPCLHGYEGLAELRLAARAAARTDAERAHADRAAARALRSLDRFAIVFPIARPAANRLRAEAAWLAGRRAEAVRRWRRALALAEALDMPYESARAWLAIALAGARLDGRDAAAEARRRLSDLGSAHHLETLARASR